MSPHEPLLHANNLHDGLPTWERRDHRILSQTVPPAPFPAGVLQKQNNSGVGSPSPGFCSWAQAPLIEQGNGIKSYCPYKAPEAPWSQRPSFSSEPK